MKKLTDVLVLKKEKDASLIKRREDYALKRDLLAMEYNNAISRRLVSEEEVLVRCMKCGREFLPEKVSEADQVCPECR